jgi:hypothetical protein
MPTIKSSLGLRRLSVGIQNRVIAGLFRNKELNMPQVKGDSPSDDGVVGTTNIAGKSGVFGFNAVAGGNGVAGISNDGNGVFARSKSFNGLFGESETGSGVHGHSFNQIGVFGISDSGDGIVGVAKAADKSGIFGSNESTSNASAPGGSGVFGLTVAPGAAGVFGANNSSTTGRGVQGNGPEAGVGGFSEAGFGVIGQSKRNSGVIGTSENGQGLTAFSDNDIAVFARGATFSGVFEGALVVNKGPNPKDPNKPPSDINGSIVINDGNLFVNKGDVILAGADCAEEFDIVDVEDVESGTVMVINDDGALRISNQPYDKRVAGVISGAGNYKPGLILDRQQSQNYRKPIALMGKVYCKVDASYGAIEVGDLLTTSPTLGHAMKANDPLKAFGSVIGKALRPLDEGQGLIPILIALQ